MSEGPPARWEPADARRLDVRSLASRLVSLSALRQQWGPLLAVLAAFGFNGGLRVLGVAGAVVLVVGGSVGFAVAEWLRFSYSTSGGRLVVRRGLLRRELTVVPLDRIRGVDVHASAVQRLLGIAVVRVDAAATGGRHDEAVLDAVSRQEAVRLRGVLLREAAQADAARVAAEPTVGQPAGARAGPPRPAAAPVTLARLQPGWLLYAPLVGGYLVAPVAAVVAVQQYLDELRVPVLGRVAAALGDRRPGALPIALAAVAVLLLCALGAIAAAAVTNWGFTLSRRGGSLVNERGLLSRREVSLEIARIRGYALAEPLPLRLAGAARLTALVTGLGGERSRRGQLLPLGPASVARRVSAEAVLPYAAPLRAHPAAARRRRLIRAVAPWLVLAGVSAGLGWWAAAAAAGALALLGVPLGLDRYRGLGHGLDARAVAVRSGSLRRRLAVLDRRGVVGWRVRQTFFQRRAGLATVTVATGAGDGGYDVVDVGAPDAVRFLHAVTPRIVGPLLADPPAAGTERALS